MTKCLGIVLSAGGAAFEAMARIIGPSHCTFSVVTDRECGGEHAARRVGAQLSRIQAKSKSDKSKQISEIFRRQGVDCCLLNYDRLVSAELYQTIHTSNVHPAALPSFPGLSGVEDAHRYRVRILGCTLHEVDQTVDCGPIVAQIACGVDPNWGLPIWQKHAYLMKVYCNLVWAALMTSANRDGRTPLNASHALPSEWLSAFHHLQNEEKLKII